MIKNASETVRKIHAGREGYFYVFIMSQKSEGIDYVQ